MIGVTLFGIFLTPVFYSVIQWFSERRTRETTRTGPHVAPAEAPTASPPEQSVSMSD
jgi:multidrug efflux pump